LHLHTSIIARYCSLDIIPFLFLLPPHPRPPLFPYTTLFRSLGAEAPIQIGMVEAHGDSGLRLETLDLPRERRQQSQSIQHGRPEVHREVANPVDEVVHDALHLFLPVSTAGAMALDHEQQAREELADLVVQLPRDLAMLRLLDVDQSL